MPYYQRSWNVALGEPPSKQASMKKLRKNPTGGTAQEHKHPPPKETPAVDGAKVEAIRNQMRSQVTELKATKCATPIKGDDNFLNYVSIYSCMRHHLDSLLA